MTARRRARQLIPAAPLASPWNKSHAKDLRLVGRRAPRHRGAGWVLLLSYDLLRAAADRALDDRSSKVIAKQVLVGRVIA
jgi:hypothetical protein